MLCLIVGTCICLLLLLLRPLPSTESLRLTSESRVKLPNITFRCYKIYKCDTCTRMSLCTRACVCVCLFSLTKLHHDINDRTEWEGNCERLCGDKIKMIPFRTKMCGNERVPGTCTTIILPICLTKLYIHFQYSNLLFDNNNNYHLVHILRQQQPPHSLHTEIFLLFENRERCTTELSRCCDMHVNPNQQIRMRRYLNSSSSSSWLAFSILFRVLRMYDVYSSQ